MDDDARLIPDRHDHLLPEPPPLSGDNLERAYTDALLEVAGEMGGSLVLPRALPDGQTEYAIIDGGGREWIARVSAPSWAAAFRELRAQIHLPMIESVWPAVVAKHRLPDADDSE